MRVLLTTFAFVLSSAIASAQTRTVSPLRTQNHIEGSGCRFWIEPASSDQLHVFEWDLDGEAWVNVGESDVRLSLVESREDRVQDDPPSVGDRWLRRFAANEVAVTLETKTTALCPADRKECESWSEEGELRVTIEGGTIGAKVKGVCGS